MTETNDLGRLFCSDSIELLEQSMLKIRNCLSQLEEGQIWQRPHESQNSIGHLLLHVCGNLRQWTISGIGGLPDSRQREQEFSNEAKLPVTELLQHVEQHVAECRTFLKEVASEQLRANYSIQGFSVSGLQAINHTVTHFVGHTHQIIMMTRQLLPDSYRFAWSPEDGRDQLPI